MEMEALIREYLLFCGEQKKLSPATLKGYRIDLCQFAQAVADCEKPFCRESLNQYCRVLNKGYMPRTAKRKLASLKAFCRWLEFEDRLEDDPFRRIHTKTPPVRQLPRYLPLEHMERILQTAYRKKEEVDQQLPSYRVCVRNVAILELLFATGLRVSELCSLKVENVQEAPVSVRIVGKGNKERIIPIENTEVIAALQAYFTLFSDCIREGGFLFYNQRKSPLSQQSVRNMVAKYAKAAGVPGKITPHVFRHTFATLMLEQDVDIRYIQSLLGHSSIRTTEIYASATDSKKRKIIAGKHPRNSFKIL